MKAIVQIPFSGVPDGEHHVREFLPNDIVEGELAEVALREGWARCEQAAAPLQPREIQALGGAPEPFREDREATVRRHRKRSESHSR